MGNILPSSGAFWGTEIFPVVPLPEGRSSGHWAPFLGGFGSSGVLGVLGGSWHGPTERVESALRPFLVRVPLLSVPTRVEGARLGGAVDGRNPEGLGAGGVSKFSAGPRLARTQHPMPLSAPYSGSPYALLARGGSPIQTDPKLVFELKERRMEAGNSHNRLQEEGPDSGFRGPRDLSTSGATSCTSEATSFRSSCISFTSGAPSFRSSCISITTGASLFAPIYRPGRLVCPVFYSRGSFLVSLPKALGAE